MGENVWHKIAVPPKQMQRFAPKVMVSVELGRFAPRRHHTLSNVVFLYFIGMAYCLPRRLAVFLCFLLHLFVLFHVRFQHLDVAFHAVLVLVRFVVEQILILGR